MRRVRLRYLLTPIERTGQIDLPVLSVYREHGVVPKESRSDNFNKTPEDLSRYQRAGVDDLVVNKMKAWSGSVGISHHDGIVSPDYLVCEVSNRVIPRFLHHLLRSSVFVAEMRRRSHGIRPSQERLYWGDLADIEVALPSRPEQRRIADFLDDQVALLDRATSLRRRQVLLLGERRSAALADFFSSVGGARKTVRLLRLLSAPPCYGVLVPQRVDDGVHFIRVNDLPRVQKGLPPHASIPQSQSAEYRRTVVTAGDVLTSVVGTLGSAAIVSAASSGANVARAVCRLQPAPGVSPWLIYAWLGSPQFKAQAERATGSGTAQATLNMGDLAKFELGLPAHGHHNGVACDAAAMLAEYETAQQAMARSLVFLEERKQALITAAVTGEFDVSTARRVA